MIRLDTTDLRLNEAELRRRLSGDSSDETMLKCRSSFNELISVAEASYCVKETAVAVADGTVDLSFTRISSRALAEYLKSTDKAYIVAVTLGVSVDRLLQKKSVISTAEHFIFDAVASAVIESACDRVQALLPTETNTRFSPGYGDLALALQAPLLKFLKADGIKLTQSGLMIPTKSVTFIAR